MNGGSVKIVSSGSFGSGSGIYEYEYEYQFEFPVSLSSVVPSSFATSLNSSYFGEPKTVRVLGYGINLI